LLADVIYFIRAKVVLFMLNLLWNRNGIKMNSLIFL